MARVRLVVSILPSALRIAVWSLPRRSCCDDHAVLSGETSRLLVNKTRCTFAGRWTTNGTLGGYIHFLGSSKPDSVERQCIGNLSISEKEGTQGGPGSHGNFTYLRKHDLRLSAVQRHFRGVAVVIEATVRGRFG